MLSLGNIALTYNNFVRESIMKLSLYYELNKNNERFPMRSMEEAFKQRNPSSSVVIIIFMLFVEIKSNVRVL